MFKGYRLLVAYVAVVFMLLLWLCSCRTQYVPVETVCTEVIHQHDTVLIEDSTRKETNTVIREADTAEIERLTKEYGFKLDKAQKTILILRKEVEQEKSKVKEVSEDSSDRTQVIEVPYPVERKLSKWEQFCLDYGKVMLGTSVALVIVVAFLIARWLALLRRKA